MNTEEYFQELEDGLNEAMAKAQSARGLGKDPETQVEILLAIDLAERVEKLVGITGVANRIRELELAGMTREEAALVIGLDFARGKLGTGSSKIESVDSAIRTSVALLTEGVVAAPIEGIARVALGKNDDGTDYLKVYYAGPIRSAGGTAQALSVLVADYVRRNIGIAPWKPRPEEIERYVEEIGLYNRIAGLQYSPSDDEIRIIVKNCPICIDGEPTEEEEVSGFRDLPRIETNRVRGGMALVTAEGLALKRPKIKKHVSKLGIEGWEWLDSLASIRENETDSSPKYLRDLIAGRPVFSHPSRPGGFRLRYGRARNTGLAASGINPATMFLLGEFMAPGTQIKLEQPGKAAAVAPVSSIEGPTVRLLNGDVVRIDDPNEILAWMPSGPKDPKSILSTLRAKISKILDLGEILVSYGEFLENNRSLAPASYTFEWWAAELEKAGGDPAGLENIGGEEAVSISKNFDIPLHPKHTFLWHDLSLEEFRQLALLVSTKGVLVSEKLYLPLDAKEPLETLLVLHKIRDGSIFIEDPLPFLLCLGIVPQGLRKSWEIVEGSTLDAINRIAGISVRARAPTRIGARMGRPEKSDKRLMKPPPHVLFPIGEAGGKSRLINDAISYESGNGIGLIELEIESRVCTNCGKEGVAFKCDCGGHTHRKRTCQRCGILAHDRCPKCGRETTSFSRTRVDVKKLYANALDNLGEPEPKRLKGVIGLTSRDKTPEPLEKGILRAKHGLSIFKDGTIRYDLTDMPLTHFRPCEINTSPEKLMELGYTEDIYKKPLTSDEQICELKVQDIILSKGGTEYLLKATRFIDDLLIKFYKFEPYYRASLLQDLLGTLLVGLAPHTSAGVLCRLIGYTNASACFGHPYFHSAKRRNCDGDEDCVMLLMDALLNFSISYLPERRGGKMDAPLVLTMRLNPAEVDKEVHNLDVTRIYPLEFFEASLRRVNPKDLEEKFDLISKRLGTERQYIDLGFSHDTVDIAAGPRTSAYKTLETMIEKMEAQLELAKLIRAVDEKDVAERVISSHFLPDLIGNLHAFSKQKVRCTKCGTKYRRPLLREACPKCGGHIVLTVHEGSVRKYLEVSMKVAEDYQVSNYIRQRLELVRIEIDSLFKNEKSKQMALVEFM
ncbi:MAG: DNA polymerase II large subunit [Methanotrichaceae archaeon]|nr:DNA polymerase II large subunit [Methanotrichaceae archaeon]